jgi:hypothetical protein
MTIKEKKRKEKKRKAKQRKDKKRNERKEKKRKLICAFMNLFFKSEQQERARQSREHRGLTRMVGEGRRKRWMLEGSAQGMKINSLLRKLTMRYSACKKKKDTKRKKIKEKKSKEKIRKEKKRKEKKQGNRKK